MTTGRRCTRYTLANRQCTRPSPTGSDWCGVCAGKRAPGNGLGDHVVTGLANIQNQVIARDSTPEVDAKEAEWAAAVGYIDEAQALSDDELAARATGHQDLAALATYASEAEARNLPAASAAAEALRQRRQQLQVTHLEQVAQGPDPEWVDHLNTIADDHSRHDELMDHMGAVIANDPQGEAAAETAGRLAAQVEFANRAEGTSLHNADAFDAWVDLEMSNGGYREPHGRAKARAFRDELVSVTRSVYGASPAIR